MEQQLQRDGVQSGSALERLIRSNQDFSMLRPDEATDDRGIPPWLRVFWRKAHPTMLYTADDPLAGYPLILKEIHEWVVTHQNLIAGELQAPAAPEKSLSTGANLRISGLQSSPRSESDIRINFWNPNKVIAASNDIETSGMLAEFYSSDGGASWGQTSLPLVGGDVFQGDPAVDWTSDGTAWSTALGIVNTLTDIKVKAYKSTNGGATWSLDATVSGSQTATDKEMLWTDHSATSAFKDNLYVVWINGAAIWVNRRTGPAGSWGTPVEANNGSTYNARPGADVKTNSSGDVFVFWPGAVPGAGQPKGILLNKSTDGGLTFQPTVVVGGTSGTGLLSIPAQAHRTVLIGVSSAAYRTAGKNLVYATWHDLTGVAGCTSNANAPGTSTASTCKTRVWFARSTDGGATWAAPVMLNNQASLNDQFFPHLVVDEANGVVSLIYYDTVNDPGRLKTDVFYQSSYDDGVTWGVATKVTTAQTDETVAGADSGNQYGDYTGLSGFSGVFLPSWTDRRNNVKEEVWTAVVHDATAPPPPFDKVGCAKIPPNGSEFRLNLQHGTGSPNVRATISGIAGEPLAGDWNGDGIDSIGTYKSSTATFKLRNSNSAGAADYTFTFGTVGAGWKPLAGHWTGGTVDTVGLYDPSTATFYLRNSNTTGPADITFTFTGAASTWLPIAGDWNGTGTTTVGLYDPATSTFYLRNSNTTGGADITFVFGSPGTGLQPEAGDWDGDGRDSIGVYNSTTGVHLLRNQNNAGPADYSDLTISSFPRPVAGNWDGL